MVAAKLIFDVGLHKGEDSAFYLAKGFDVVAVEAHPSLCEEVSRRLAPYVASGRLVIVNAAIAENEEPVTFYVNRSLSVWGTTSPRWAERNAKRGALSDAITVPGIRFETLLARYGTPYYLKVDIEGADMLCLRALAGLDQKPEYVSFESSIVSMREIREEFALLASLGYSRFKLVQQLAVDSQRCPNPPREGRYVEHAFESGSSGLFGEEAPGSWLTADQAIGRYRRWFPRYKLSEIASRLERVKPLRSLARAIPPGGWHDTHAGR